MGGGELFGVVLFILMWLKVFNAMLLYFLCVFNLCIVVLLPILLFSPLK